MHIEIDCIENISAAKILLSRFYKKSEFVKCGLTEPFYKISDCNMCVVVF